MGFEGLWWLRGGPSSQSSPVGRRGKTSRPHACPQAGCAKVSVGRRGKTSRPPLLRRALGARALFQFPPEGGRFEALLFGERRTSITRGGCEAAPHLNLLPWGEEVRLPGPAPPTRPWGACPLSVSPRGGKAGGEGDSRIAPTGEMDSRFRGNDGCGWVAQGSPLGEGKTPPPRPARLRRGLPGGVHRPQPLLLRGEEQRGGGAGEHRRFRGRRPEREAAGELQRVVGPQRVTL